jgi:hypothetical protein
LETAIFFETSSDRITMSSPNYGEDGESHVLRNVGKSASRSRPYLTFKIKIETECFSKMWENQPAVCNTMSSPKNVNMSTLTNTVYMINFLA